MYYPSDRLTYLVSKAILNSYLFLKPPEVHDLDGLDLRWNAALQFSVLFIYNTATARFLRKKNLAVLCLLRSA